MHEEILSAEQKQLLSLIKSFSDRFYLVGGTALALQLGHRRSIDFDLFTSHSFENRNIRDQLTKRFKIEEVLIESKDEFTLVINRVRFTFYRYQYKIAHEVSLDKVITMPDVLTIGAMKAAALGGRAKWKDYVDLYFIFKRYSLNDVVTTATTIFGKEFNEKLFREQLVYYKDVSRAEKIEYLPGFETKDETVKKFLKEVSLQE